MSQLLDIRLLLISRFARGVSLVILLINNSLRERR